MFTLSLDSRIARVTLDRPSARNAIPAAGWTDLALILGRVAASDARALCLDSAVPGSFCAGADLKDLALLTDGGALRTGMATASDAIAGLAIPSIAVVDGGCFGAGVALAMACDLIVAGPAASFAIPPARLGIVYPAADVARLVARVGRAQAIRLLATAETIDGAEAARIGLATLAVADASASAAALAQAIAGNAPESVRSLKAMAAGGLTGSAADAAFDMAFAGASFAEGIAAMRGRRAPEFL